MPVDLYKRQNRYFASAYEDGHHGWPTEGATPHVARYIRMIARRLKSPVALDLGCGEGRHAIYMARHKYAVHAVDIIPLAVRKARTLAMQSLGPRQNIRFSVGNALNLKLPREHFDLALDYGCFHHILKRDWARYMDNIARVLKPDGYLVLSVFSTRYRHSKDEKRRREWWIHRDHYDRFFTPSSIREAFRDRFRILEIREEAHGMKVFYHALMRKKE